MGAPRITISAKVDKLLTRLDRAGTKMDDSVKSEISISAFAIHADAKRRAPVKTGRLRDSIGVRLENGGRAAVIGTSVFYARFQKQFLQPAWRRERKDLIVRLNARIDEAVGAPG